MPLGEGWEMQHFIKKGFTHASNFPLLLLLPLTLEASLPSTFQDPGLPTSRRKASWSHPPSPSVLPSWGPARRARGGAGRLAGLIPPSTAFCRSPVRLSPGVRSITLPDQACSAGGSSGRLPLGAGSPSQPYLI